VKKLAEQQKSAADRSAGEIRTLQSRVKEIEPLQKNLTAREADITKLKLTARTDKEQFTAEITTLRTRVRDHDSLQKNLAKKDEQIEKLQASQKANSEQSKADIAKLQASLNAMQKEAADSKKLSDRQLEALQKSSAKTQADAERKLAEAKAQIDRLSPLQKQLKSQESEVARLSAKMKSSDDKYQKDLSDLRARLQTAEKLRAEVSSRDKQLERLQRQIDTAQKENADNKNLVASLKRDVSGKQSEIGKLNSKAEKLLAAEKELSDARKANTANSKELEQAGRRLKTLEDNSARNQAANDSKLKALKADLASAQGDIRKYRPFESKVSVHEKTIADLKAQLAAQKAEAKQLAGLQKQLDRSVQQHGSDVAKKDASIARLQAEIAKLKARPKPAPKPKAVAPKKPAPKPERRTADGKKTPRKDGMDDLKLIFGIGPKIEKMLNKNGINRFEDIAVWKQTDIDKYADMLEGFSDRIERDEWVLSAQQLVDGTYNWEERRKAREAKAADEKANTRLTADGKKTTRKDGQDDLKLIFGIGPKIEKMLNSNGVKRFEDIAAWKPSDIERFSEKLEGFSDRIERDEWVSSAQQIIDGTYNWTERKTARDNQKKK